MPCVEKNIKDDSGCERTGVQHGPNRHQRGILCMSNDSITSIKIQEPTSPDNVEHIDIDELIEQLASLSPIQYDQIRKEEARKLGIQLSTLDSYVKNARKIECVEETSLFIEIEPWHEPINPEELLSELTDTIQRFIVCAPETALAASLWASMTWFIDEIDVAPLALITAPEKRCGKSQLLSILGKVTNKPLPSSNISSAALFRAIDKWQPTLLIDEADAFVRDNEELRGLLNAGHTRDSAFTLRCVGEEHEPKKFLLWGAKALAGIGKLADTLMDRSIVLELRRKLPDEKIERLRHAPDELFGNLKKKLARFADDYRMTVSAARPELPEELHDRAQDNWEPLLAVADTAGPTYGQLAREAAIKLSAKGDDSKSLGVELLEDIHEVFDTKKVDRMFTDDLIKALCEDKEKRWGTYNYRNLSTRITPKQLGQLLSNYNIKSTNIRGIIDAKGASGIKKGYYLSQFEDAFLRYLPFSAPTPEVDATTATNIDNAPKSSTGARFRVAAANTTKTV